jgi:hypothetical protein
MGKTPQYCILHCNTEERAATRQRLVRLKFRHLPTKLDGYAIVPFFMGFYDPAPDRTQSITIDMDRPSESERYCRGLPVGCKTHILGLNVSLTELDHRKNQVNSSPSLRCTLLKTHGHQPQNWLMKSAEFGIEISHF